MNGLFSRARLLAAGTASLGVGLAARPAASQTSLGETLEKIKRNGALTVGARQEAFPFGYLQGSNWTGFSTDLAREVHSRVERELKQKIELKLNAVTSATRIALLQNGTVDLDAGSTVITIPRTKVVDFSIPFFVTSTELMVPKNGPIKTVADLSGKKVGLPQGSLDIDLFRRLNEAKRWPQPVQVITYQDQADGFQALLNGAVAAYSTDGVLLAGFRAKAKNPNDWEIINPRFNATAYGFAVRQNNSKFLEIVNETFVDMFESGGYMKLYEKYFGKGGPLPFEPTEELHAMIAINSWPK